MEHDEPASAGHDPDPAATAPELLPEAYEELHALAERWFRRQAPGHTLQPTALVHEAYMKLARGGSAFESRTHFVAVAARAMRQILVDRARRVRSERHGGNAARIAVDEGLIAGEHPNDVDLLSLEDALSRLTELDERKGRVVELRFFGGLDIDQTAQVLGVARSTVTEDWRMARAWLVKELGAS
ncbi:MAG: sigma-70 family RNA polymerase sigma factor [Planctomycetes bacterium]|nr:sigma-70 family RNA polymerase sigma factor [Planctomycetota bacterium]